MSRDQLELPLGPVNGCPHTEQVCAVCRQQVDPLYRAKPSAVSRWARELEDFARFAQLFRDELGSDDRPHAVHLTSEGGD